MPITNPLPPTEFDTSTEVKFRDDFIDDSSFDGGRSEVLNEPERSGSNTGERGGRTIHDESDKENNPYTDQNGSPTVSSDVSNIETTIDKLNDYLNKLGSNLSSWKEFYDLMQVVYNATGAEDFVKGSDARLAITEKIADMVYNFTLTLYNNAYASQMWYEQQEYNSPSQQLKRLCDAGLAGMFSTIGSGYAQNAATSYESQPTQESDAAKIMQQAKQNRIQNVLSGIGMGVQLASLGVTAAQAPSIIGMHKAESFLNKAQSYGINTLTPLQARNLMFDSYVKSGSIRLMEANEALAKANIPLIESQRVANFAQVNFLKENIKQGWANWQRMLDYGNKSLDLSRELGFAGFENQRQVAQIGAAASNYAADRSLQATEFSTLGKYTYDTEETGYQEVNERGEVHGDIKFDTDLGFTSLDTKVGGIYESGGKKYKKVRYNKSYPLSGYIKLKMNEIDNISPQSYKFYHGVNHMSDYIQFGKTISGLQANQWKGSIIDLIDSNR